MCCEISPGLLQRKHTDPAASSEGRHAKIRFHVVFAGRCDPILSDKDAERETYMPVTDSETLQRLRREETVAEAQGRQALNISVLLKQFPQYDAARGKADVLLAKAASLREQIIKIETI
jgi:hypothetical protein